MSEPSKISLELICRIKDSAPSNLNEVFESYGCNTLEAKVPVVSNPVADKLPNMDPEQQMYATLALKSESANMALEGRHPRTRNRQLKIVELGRETMISAGNRRERSPIDEADLDNEIEEYMRKRALLKSGKSECSSDEPMQLDTEEEFPEPLAKPVPTLMPKPPLGSRQNKNNLPEDLPEILDNELDTYMKEAARKKAQKKLLEEQSDREKLMEELEEGVGLTPDHELDYDEDF